jgi:PAS domain S-box-containing protein
VSSLRPPRRWPLDLAFSIVALVAVLATVATMYLSEILHVVDAIPALIAAALILVAGSGFVGVRIHRLAREADDHRRRYLQAMEAREHDLRLANERFEAAIAERTAAMRVSETKFRTLISNIPGVSYRCADDADYTMEFISDAIEQLSGYPAADFTDNAVRTYGSIIHPDDVDEVARIVADGLKNKRSYEIEYRVIHKDGAVRSVFERGRGVFDDAGKAIYCDGVIFDVTERRHIEAELRESETRFRTLLANVPGACYRCAYDNAYTMEFISDAITDISGYRASDFIGNSVRTYASIIHPDDLAMVSRLVDEARTARTQSSIEYRIVHRDGSVRWVYERGQGIYDADGKILHIDGAIFDITARKHLEEQVVGQKQMATIGKVAATVSHELRNPLGAISNSMAFLRQMTANRQLGVEKALDRVDRNIERCNTIISDLLEYTSQKELSRTATPIAAWLTAVLDEHRLPEDILLVRDLQADDEVAIDREKLGQVVINLIENAAQALLDPGWDAPEGHEFRITVRTESAGPHIRLAVIDTGPGIPEHVLPRIFEPLFTTKSFGVGLGLPTVRQIVEQHGGTLHVESAANAGTTFTVFLPRHGEAAAHATDPATRGAAA